LFVSLCLPARPHHQEERLLISGQEIRLHIFTVPALRLDGPAASDGQNLDKFA
jgi:hypothetical protein